jgi:DNA-binding MarR family transcriptional regulator
VARARIIDDDGQIIGEINEGDRILRAESLEYLENYQIWKIEHFYKGNTEELRKMFKCLSTSEKAFLFCMAVYVGYEDCCLKHDNGNELSFDDMVEISGMSRSTVSEVLNSLIKKDIIYRGKNSRTRQYFINPWLFCKGQRINKVLRTMFKNYRVKVMGGQKWGDIRNA